MSLLLIVESPAKAKKIKSFYKDKPIIIKASFGHICDLDKKKLSIDIHNHFKPHYIILSDKKKIIQELKNIKCSKIFLAADDDREGESIAWHCGRYLKLPFHEKNRITFNEITKKAFDASIKNPKQVDINKVNAQQARRVIDRLVGYKLSPLLWKFIDTDVKGLSAGRVQSCLLHMLHKHETSINEFIPTKKYKMNGTIKKDKQLNVDFIFKKDINTDDVNIILHNFINNNKLTIIKINETTEKSYSPHPFITSTLQQQAQKEYGFKVSYIMSMAQKLYDDGYITYIRTDSTYINEEFETKLKEYIVSHFGKNYYTKKTMKQIKGAQQAHEAIRPTDLNVCLPSSYKKQEHLLYNLILKRTVQSYMSPVIYDVLTILFSHNYSDKYGNFQSKEKEIQFNGYLEYSSSKEIIKLVNHTSVGDIYELLECNAKQIESNPPNYYNESSIVKQLEKNGIGRPSTYSNIINTIYNRNYTTIETIPKQDKQIDVIQFKKNKIVIKKDIQSTTLQKNRIILTDLGKLVLDYLETNFSTIINCEFTSLVEKDLDEISLGNLDWIDIVRKVYSMFSSTVDKQLQIVSNKSNKSNVEIVSTVHYKKDMINILNGQYGCFINYNKKNHNLSNYLKWKNITINDISSNDIDVIINYPKKITIYKKKPIYIQIGPYGYYLKYNNTNYRIHQNPPYTKEYCLNIIN